MKTSNKLLIAFAAALIIVPILSMVYVSKAYYVDGQTWSDLAKQDDSFDGKSDYMDAIPLNQFTTINIADGKKTTLYIHLVKDSKFGVKVNKTDKGFVKFNVDKDGQLQIELTAKTKERGYINLLIYAPETKELNASNVSTLELDAKGDAIDINLKKFEELRFAGSTKFQKLNIYTEDGYTNIEGNAVAKSIFLNLKNANFRSAGVSFQDLNISSMGKSNVDVFGGKIDQAKFNIQNLTLKTTDSANVIFRDIAIGNAKGSLSDQTTIQLPVASLKQILK